MLLDLNLPAEPQVIDVLRNNAIQEGMDVNELIIALPEVVSMNGYNTRVGTRVNDIDNGDIRNNLALYYDRYDLLDIVTNGLTVPAEGLTTVHEIVPILSTLTGIAFVTEDFYNDPLVDGSMPLRAHPESYGFYGTVPITVANNGDIGFTVLRTEDEKLVTVNGFYLRIS